MTLVQQHITSYDRIKPYTTGRTMLMLGNQDNPHYLDMKTIFGCTEYKTLDPDRGDFTYDIQSDLSFMEQKWGAVFNLGTLEHVWDVHLAYSNALKLIEVGGYYIGHAPVAGFENHGIHITHRDAILTFLKINGFDVLQEWGEGVIIPWEGRLSWHIARKNVHQTEFKRPQQVWINGKADHFE